jgi:hypothetical protein
MEVKKMEKENNPETNHQNKDIDQDEIMNRVNQSFDEMVQDVRKMIKETNNNNQLS